MAAFYTLLYVAPSKDAEAIAIDANEDAAEQYPSCWLRHIGDEEIVALWDLIDAESNEGTIMGDMVYASPDGDVMVMTVPREFVHSLATVPEDALEELTDSWLSSELLTQWTRPDLRAVLNELKSICETAVETGLPVQQVCCL